MGSWIDEVVFPELNEEECKKIIEGFHKEARAAGVLREREKRDRSEGREQPPHKRPRDDDRKRRDDRRSRDGYSRDRGGCSAATLTSIRISHCKTTLNATIFGPFKTTRP